MHGVRAPCLSGRSRIKVKPAPEEQGGGERPVVVWRDVLLTSTNAPPEHVRELSLGAVQFVQRSTGVVLDFTPETLPLLDYYLTTVRDAVADVQALVAPAAGTYFGEVVRRAFPVRWYAPGRDYAVWRIEFELCFLHFNPVAFAHEAIHGREIIEGGAGFGVQASEVDAVKDALALLGTVAEEDYFKLSTRLEVLTMVVDRLVAAGMVRGEGDQVYDALAYHSVLDDDVFAAS